MVIFGTGGSGTRALQVVTDRAGYFMGTNLNRPGDSLDIGQFMRRWLNRYLVESSWVERMRQGSDEGGFGHPRGMAADFRATIEDHRAAISRISSLDTGQRRKSTSWIAASPGSAHTSS